MQHESIVVHLLIMATIALKHYAYPGQDHQSPVVDQGVYRVTALGMELGDMTVTLSPETHSIFNVTAENHIMYERPCAEAAGSAGWEYICSKRTDAGNIAVSGLELQASPPYTFQDRLLLRSTKDLGLYHFEVSMTLCSIT